MFCGSKEQHYEVMAERNKSLKIKNSDMWQAGLEETSHGSKNASL